MTTRLTTDQWRREFGARLRAARGQRSLNTIEQHSNGRFPAVVIGSYERGDRNPSMERINAYARFLGIPTSALIPDLNPYWTRALGGAS